MGNIIEKLYYLRETCGLLLPSWIYSLNGYKTLTLREYAEWLTIWIEHFHGLLYNQNLASQHTPLRQITLANGTEIYARYNIDDCIVAPPCPKQLDVMVDLAEFPITISSTKTIGSQSANFEHVDLSAIGQEQSCSFHTKYVAIKSLILPKHCRLDKYCVYGGTQGVTFSNGLKLGEYVYANSLWLSFTLSNECFVDCLDGFYGNMYLSKIPMSAETMVGLFNKLKDFKGTSTSYTFNIGSSNKAKLTDEQLAIAIDKGWNVT